MLILRFRNEVDGETPTSQDICHERVQEDLEIIVPETLHPQESPGIPAALEATVP